MTLLKVQPDTVWLPQEVRERFTAPADMLMDATPEQQAIKLALYSYETLKFAISKYEKRGWKFIERVPQQRPPAGMSCCKRVRLAPPGTELPIQYLLSPFQGDADDSTNTGEAVNNEARALVHNKQDWVAVLHFVKPAIFINQAELGEWRNSEREGFVRPEHLPHPVKEALAKRRRSLEI